MASSGFGMAFSSSRKENGISMVPLMKYLRHYAIMMLKRFFLQPNNYCHQDARIRQYYLED